ncbi:hypothetical protein HX045_03195 [Myroides odoratimimus]|uniref:Uncharacterized protein n=2 Tax=Myroides odoratimimus TaxID=76832 RepID=A0ABP2NF52_9FLAO|nr:MULTISPECIES: hypothetical protein [Myroides]AJA69317.1 hypothetical protein MYRA21_2187 [Myroides sp. A21]EHO11965.1 hypothetical protein HMPREF9712_00212 [Myroides odoratimimus CCUG 10230]EHO12975.1 hypothetical protein HMPREF9714_01092 [Myroides odoratimimus CCUG 12901]EHO13593.1 hypothetical protein HMPREF9715_01131 [Myroides odoratimimus CIP 101113]EKB03314.1 hypothetical protein HMPREF9711_02641 [Myroides odoratimimus CCUG 3837]
MRHLRYIVVALCVTTFCIGQNPQDKNTSINDSLASLYQSKEEVNPGNKLTLQQYVEDLYINTCKLYHKGAIPTIEPGNFSVMVIDKKGDGNTMMKSKDLALLKVEDVKEIRFEKSKQTDVMYGYKKGDFGMIVITK